MEANNVLSQLTFSESSPVKTMLLQQKYFGLMRIALGKGVKIPPHQGGAFGFFSVLQDRGIFTWGKEDVELAQNQYLYIKADDSDGLDQRLLDELRVEMVAPHRKGRKKPKTQDGRKLRPYRRRWKVERMFAWLQIFRRIVVRYEYHADNFLGMVQLGCAIILLRLFWDELYTNEEKAKKSFNLMIEKMRAAKGGPFNHLMPINKFYGNVYMAIGMGFVHYIIWSGNYLLWLQTDQPFGTALPPRILALYPAWDITC